MCGFSDQRGRFSTAAVFRWIMLVSVMAMACLAEAQDTPLSTGSKRAEKFYQKGEEAYRMRELDIAEKNFKLALEADSVFFEAMMMLADLYEHKGRDSLAIRYYRQAANRYPDKYPALFFFLGRLEYKTGCYADAAGSLSKYLSYPETDEENRRMAEKELTSAVFAADAILHPVPFDPVNLGENINSEYNEYFPCMTADGIFLLFTRLIPDERARTGNQEDFFISRFDGAVWMPAQPVGSPINTLHNEGAPTLSVDGNQLIFTACKGWNGYGPGREGYGRCDLFLSNRAGTSWSEPRNLGPPVNTSHWESQPSLASDGMTLYYVSNRSGGYNIWRVGKDPAGLWGDPEMLGERINTPGDESSVFIHPDNRTLYFSSDGHPGMGGMDIFLSRKDTAGNWSDPVNLGYPINTRFDENSLMVSADGTKAFFASDREGGGGGLDIYSFNLYKEIRPVPVTYVKGRVYDKETGLHLQARFRLSDLGSGSLAAESVSNPSTGEFLVCLNTQRRYALNVDKDGYLFYSEHFNLTGENPREDPFLMNIPLQPVRSGERTILKNVFFETDSYELLYDSRAELNRLVEFMKTNPRIKIEISGYTDDTGESGYNQLLSENRARSVYGYLLEQGVPPERLSFAGFGENYPVDTNKTEEGRANNRRTEFKITGTTDAQ